MWLTISLLEWNWRGRRSRRGGESEGGTKEALSDFVEGSEHLDESNSLKISATAFGPEVDEQAGSQAVGTPPTDR